MNVFVAILQQYNSALFKMCFVSFIFLSLSRKKCCYKLWWLMFLNIFLSIQKWAACSVFHSVSSCETEMLLRESWNDYDGFWLDYSLHINNFFLSLCLSLSSRSLARPQPSRQLRPPRWSQHSLRYQTLPSSKLLFNLPASLCEETLCQHPVFNQWFVVWLTSDLPIICTMCSISFRVSALCSSMFLIVTFTVRFSCAFWAVTHRKENFPFPFIEALKR